MRNTKKIIGCIVTSKRDRLCTECGTEISKGDEYIYYQMKTKKERGSNRHMHIYCYHAYKNNDRDELPFWNDKIKELIDKDDMISDSEAKKSEMIGLLDILISTKEGNEKQFLLGIKEILRN